MSSQRAKFDLTVLVRLFVEGEIICCKSSNEPRQADSHLDTDVFEQSLVAQVSFDF